MAENDRDRLGKFIKQRRADADEQASIRRADPRPPADRAVAFIDELEKAIHGRETDIRTMTRDLRRFEWKRRTAERIWVAASDYQIAAEADDDGKVHVIGKRHPHEADRRPARELIDAPMMSEVIDVSKMRDAALADRAAALLEKLFKTAWG